MAVDAKLVLNTNFESYTRSTPLVPDYADQTLVAITADNVVYTHVDDGSSATEGTFFEVSGQNATINVQSDIAAPEILSVTGSAGVEFNVNGGIVTGLEVETGKMLKEGRIRGPGNYYASLVAGDGKVFACSERGVLTVLKAARRWEILSSHNFNERIMATPVINEGEVLIRTDEALYSFVKARP